MESFTERIKEITRSTNLPLIVDADTGFGEGEMCARTVHEYNLAGAAGLHLEDQVFPKRCGHLDGKTLVSKDDMVHKIRIAAHAAKQCSEGDFIICARTDAAAIEGIESSIERAKAVSKLVTVVHLSRRRYDLPLRASFSLRVRTSGSRDQGIRRKRSRPTHLHAREHDLIWQNSVPAYLLILKTRL